MDKKTRTKEKIIESVAPLFNKKGYVGTSISDILSATGLSKGSVYGNFKDKEDIAVAAFLYNTDLITQRFRDDIVIIESPAMKLKMYVKCYKRYHDFMCEMGGSPVLNTLVESDDLGGKLKEISVHFVDSWRVQIVRFIEWAKDIGEIKKECDSKKLANLMLSVFEGASILSKTTGDYSYLKDSLDRVDEILDSYIIKK